MISAISSGPALRIEREVRLDFLAGRRSRPAFRSIRGQRPPYPQHSTESFPPSSFAPDEKEWSRLKKKFATLLSNFTELSKSAPAELNRQIESMHPGDAKLAGTLDAVIWQMIAHNSYHTGQIALIRRALNAWPPRAGSDTW